jgi:hypothetical protein
VLGLRLFRQKQLLLFPWILAMKMQTKILLGLVGLTMVSALAQGRWRAATEKELSSLLPARAPVEKEQIETEMRTASGVTNGKGKFFAAVVIITAGYAAEGKYGYFLTAQVPIRAGDVSLPAGAYVFGQRRLDETTIEVTFHEAASGKLVGTVKATRGATSGAIRSILIAPPKGGTGNFALGRFSFPYTISE